MRKALSLWILSVAVAVAACGSGADGPALAPAPQASPGADQPRVTQVPTAPAAAQARPARAATDAAVGTEQAFAHDFNPCDLISVEEAAEAAGTSMRLPQSRWGAQDATCIFHAEDGDGLWPGALFLQVRPNEADYDEVLEMSARENVAIETLDSLGDRAFYLTLLGHNIVVAAKGHTMNVIVRDHPEANNRDQAVDLARRIVQRLP